MKRQAKKAFVIVGCFLAICFFSVPQKVEANATETIKQIPGAAMDTLSSVGDTFAASVTSVSLYSANVTSSLASSASDFILNFFGFGTQKKSTPSQQVYVTDSAAQAAAVISSQPDVSPTTPSASLEKVSTESTPTTPTTNTVTKYINVQTTPQVLAGMVESEISRAEFEEALNALRSNLEAQIASRSQTTIVSAGRSVAPDFGSSLASVEVLTAGNFGNKLTVSGAGTSTFVGGINLGSGCFAINGTCVSGGGAGTITSLGAQYSTAQTGSAQTFATSTDTNIELTITSSGDTHTFTPSWTGTLAIARGGTGIATAPAYGQILVGNALGGYTLTATSSLGISSQWTTSGNDIYYTTGNVGIGTSSPYAKLSVVGEVVASNFIGTTTTTSTFGGAISFSGAGSVSPAYGLRRNSQNQLQFNGGTGGYVFNNTANSANLLNILDNGNVGIGTTTPYQIFGIGSTQSLSFSSVTGTLTLNGGTVDLAAASGQNLQFGVGSTAYQTITAAGNVGIATTSPFAKLAINPVAGDGHSFIIGSSTATTFVVNNAGNVGIGTTTPLALLDVEGGSIIQSGTGGIAKYSSLGAVGLRINLNTSSGNAFGSFYDVNNVLNVKLDTAGVSYFNGGNFGIGTTSPYSKLSVGGQVVAANYVATTTATSTFAGGLETNLLNVTSTIASSTFANGINLSAGCFAISGACIGAGGSSQWTTSGNNIYYTTGNVGIGTTSPYSMLSVAGQIVAKNYVATSTNATSTFAYDASVSGRLRVVQNTTNAVILGDTSGDARGTYALDLQSYHSTSDRVASGSYSLTLGFDNIADQLSATALGYNNSATGLQSTAIGYQNTASNLNTFALGISNNVSASGAFAIGSNITNSIADSLQIGPSNAAKLTILSAGNVGIGTTSPYAKLSVVGQVVAQFFSATSTTATSTFMGALGVGTASPDGNVQMHIRRDISGAVANTLRLTNGGAGDGTGASLGFSYANSAHSPAFISSPYVNGSTLAFGTIDIPNGNDGLVRMVISATGKVGIGHTLPTMPTNKLEVVGNMSIGTNYSNGGTSAPTDGLIVEGKVGIGTTSPASTFTVTGSACISGGVGATAACTTTAGHISAVAHDTAAVDLAENYFVTDQSIEAGDVIMLDTTTPLYVKKALQTTNMSAPILGIVSTQPGVLLGSTEDKNARPIALAGRVPVKFSMENGEVKIGDSLTASKTMSGYAMKANTGDVVIGTALEERSSNGKVTVFVRSHLAQGIQVGNIEAELAKSDGTLWSEFVAVLSTPANWMQARVSAATGFFKNIFAGKVTTKELCLEDVCVTKDQLKTLLQNNNVSAAATFTAPSSNPPPSQGSSTPATSGTGTSTPNTTTDTDTPPPPPPSDDSVTTQDPPVENTDPVPPPPPSETTPPPTDTTSSLPPPPPVETTPSENP